MLRKPYKAEETEPQLAQVNRNQDNASVRDLTAREASRAQGKRLPSCPPSSALWKGSFIDLFREQNCQSEMKVALDEPSPHVPAAPPWAAGQDILPQTHFYGVIPACLTQ